MRTLSITFINDDDILRGNCPCSSKTFAQVTSNVALSYKVFNASCEIVIPSLLPIVGYRNVPHLIIRHFYTHSCFSDVQKDQHGRQYLNIVNDALVLVYFESYTL